MTIEYLTKDDYSPIACPNCGSRVEVTTQRDGNIIITYAGCCDDNNNYCDGMYFSTESHLEIDAEGLIQSQYEIIARKYYYWAKSGPNGYKHKGEWC